MPLGSWSSWPGACRGGGGGGRAELLTCPYPLNVQARTPRNQRLAAQSRVSGLEGREGAIVSMSGRFKKI